MPAPERRTRTDIAVTAAIAAVVVVAACVIWWRSPARATDSTPASGAAPVPTVVTGPPAALAEAWRAPDAAAEHPLAVGGTVITADGGTVQGRDYRTGEVRWSYSRDVPLCAATAAFGAAVAVYRTGDGCSEVTAVEADSGRRGPQRSGRFDDTMRLLADPADEDGSVTAVGTTRIESWRSDLVRTVEYGRVDAPVIAGAQPREGCTMRSAAASGTRIAVIEQCPGEPGVRLTILTTTPEDPVKPDVLGSQVLGLNGAPVADAQAVAVSGDRTAVVVPHDGGADLLVYDATAARVGASALPAWDPSRAVAGPRTAGVVTVWSGDAAHPATVALDATTLDVRWRVPGALGPAERMGSELLVPVPGGLDVVGPVDGAVRRTIAVDRAADPAGAAGPVVLGTAGDTVLEQRGDTLVALRPAGAAGPDQG